MHTTCVCTLHVLYTTCTLHVHYLDTTCTVHYMHTTCTLHAHYMYTTCTLHVHYMHTTCTLHAHYMHTTCTLHAHYMHTTCTLHAHYMYTTCTLQYTKCTLKLHTHYMHTKTAYTLHAYVQYMYNTTCTLDSQRCMLICCIFVLSAIQDEHGRNYFNNRRLLEVRPVSFQAAGTTLKYSGASSSQEQITAQGPLQEKLIVKVNFSLLPQFILFHVFNDF